MPSLQEICEPRTPATGVPGVTVIANPCCSTTLGVRASRPHRVSKGKMPSLHETCEHVPPLLRLHLAVCYNAPSE
jgi:hypothetical protein